MADKLLISIESEQATVSRWRRGRLGLCECFENDEAGWAAFEAFLKSARALPTYVMVDAVEEDYRFETLPHTQGSDRQQLVARKLRQLYRNTPYCAAWIQGRDRGKRRDDIYLFAALTNPDTLFGWVQALGRQQTPVVGIYTLPVVSITLAEQLKLKAQNLLLVSQHHSGLRQTMLCDGRLRLSRLTRLDTGNGDSLTSAYAEEIQNTRLYLHALKVMNLDDQMTVALLDKDDSLGELSRTIQQSFVSTQVEHLTASVIAARLGVSRDAVAHGRDAIYLQALGQRKQSCNLAPVGMLAPYRRYWAQRAIYATSAGVALAAALWVGGNLWQRSEVDFETQRLHAATAIEQRKYEEVTLLFPKAPTSAANMKRTVEFAERIRTEARTPEATLVAVSRALEQNPSVFLRGLVWRWGSQQAAEGTAAGAAQAEDVRQRTIIDAEIRPFRGDYRSAIGSIDRFADQLSKDKNVADVRVLQLPINVSETSVLSGNTAKETQVQATTAQFKLEILLKPNL
jgi:hypothetical protein